MATTADFMTLQQQIRQEIAESLQRLREEMHTAINGRMYAISSISSAIQRLSAGPAEKAKPYRISDLVQQSWEGTHDKGQFRNCMAELHLWMQAWSDQGERILVRVESVDKVDRSTLAVDCTGADFRTIETALYQVLHTTTNEPLRMVQQVQGQRGFEAWHMIVRRYDQRNTSDRSSTYAALISNISEQLDDILRNFTNETNKDEGRFGKIRDEEKILAVKKLVPESLLNCRFRGTTLPSDESLIALENIIIDKVTTHSAKVKRIDTSAPVEIGMAAGTDGEETFEEGHGKASEIAVQAMYKGTGAKGGWSGGNGTSWSVQKHFNSGKGEKGANRAGKGQWSILVCLQEKSSKSKTIG